MAMERPRCGASLDPCRATPTAGGATVTLDLCVSCRGLWLEASELTAICPTLSDLPDRRDEIALLGGHGTGIPRCPQCPPDARGQMPYEFDVLGAKVDLCTRCGGVWLDGDEYGEVERSLEQQAAAAPAPPERAGPYRSRAREETARTGMARCAWCSVEVAAKSTFMSQSGLICRACFAAKIQRVADLRAQESISDQSLVGGLLELLLWRDTRR